MTTTERLRALHVQVHGSSMEPDPIDPTRMRGTTYCRWCASHRPDEDWRWPCETHALLDVAEAWADLMRYGQAHDYRTKTWWATVERGNAALDRLDGAL